MFPSEPRNRLTPSVPFPPMLNTDILPGDLVGREIQGRILELQAEQAHLEPCKRRYNGSDEYGPSRANNAEEEASLRKHYAWLEEQKQRPHWFDWRGVRHEGQL